MLPIFHSKLLFFICYSIICAIICRQPSYFAIISQIKIRQIFSHKRVKFFSTTRESFKVMSLEMLYTFLFIFEKSSSDTVWTKDEYTCALLCEQEYHLVFCVFVTQTMSTTTHLSILFLNSPEYCNNILMWGDSLSIA